MSESSMDRGIIPEYSELLNIDENRSMNEISLNDSNASNNNNNINNKHVSNSKAPTQFGDIEMTSVQISTKPAVIPQNATPVKAIEKQIETRRADGKRRITPMFVPISVEPDG